MKATNEFSRTSINSFVASVLATPAATSFTNLINTFLASGGFGKNESDAYIVGFFAGLILSAYLINRVSRTLYPHKATKKSKKILVTLLAFPLIVACNSIGLATLASHFIGC